MHSSGGTQKESLWQARPTLSATSDRSAVSRFGEDGLIDCVMRRADLLDHEVYHAAEILIQRSNRPGTESGAFVGARHPRRVEGDVSPPV